MPPSAYLCLHRGTSLVSRLIRWQTRSEYSHASILLPSGTHYEAREGRGVLRHPRFTLTNPSEEVDVFAVDLTPTQLDDLRHFLGAQVGKPYDWLMVARFVTRRQEGRSTSGKWFCSELAFAAFQQAGVSLLHRTEPWEVSPGLLARSPLLHGLLVAAEAAEILELFARRHSTPAAASPSRPSVAVDVGTGLPPSV